MKKRPQFPLIVWTTAAILAGMLSACGKSKTSEPIAALLAPAKSASSPTNANEPAPATDKNRKNDSKNDNSNSNSKNDKSQNSQDRNKKIIQTPMHEKSQSKDETAKPLPTTAPVKSARIQPPISEDASVLLDSAKQFSGTANDGLRAYLIFKQEQISDPSQQLLNLKLAAQIQKARLKVDLSKKQVEMRSFLQNEEILFSGNLRADSSAMLTAKKGKETFSAKMLCFDRLMGDGKCVTHVVSFSMGKAKAQIIFRNSTSQAEANFENQKCSTTICQNFYLFFRFSEVDLINSKNLQKIEMETFEVIHGRTGFKVLAITDGANIFTFTGDLLNTEAGARERKPVDTTLETEDLIGSNGQIRKNTWNQALSNVRVLANDGKGQIQLLVHLKTPSNVAPDHFLLKLNRKVPETRTVLDNGYDLTLN